MLLTLESEIKNRALKCEDFKTRFLYWMYVTAFLDTCEFQYLFDSGIQSVCILASGSSEMRLSCATFSNDAQDTAPGIAGAISDR